jgi:hypothetical protein
MVFIEGVLFRTIFSIFNKDRQMTTMKTACVRIARTGIDLAAQGRIKEGAALIKTANALALGHTLEDAIVAYFEPQYQKTAAAVCEKAASGRVKTAGKLDKIKEFLANRYVRNSLIGGLGGAGLGAGIGGYLNGTRGALIGAGIGGVGGAGAGAGLAYLTGKKAPVGDPDAGVYDVLMAGGGRNAKIEADQSAQLAQSLAAESQRQRDADEIMRQQNALIDVANRPRDPKSLAIEKIVRTTGATWPEAEKIIDANPSYRSLSPLAPAWGRQSDIETEDFYN